MYLSIDLESSSNDNSSSEADEDIEIEESGIHVDEPLDESLGDATEGQV